MTTSDIDEAKLNEFMTKVVNELGGAWSASLVIIGDKLGLYSAMADSRPITSHELASKTNTAERYIREWLANQTAGGYISYDVATGKYTLPAEHALALANENSPAFVMGLFQITSVLIKDESKIVSLKPFGQGKELTGAITILCSMGPQNDPSNPIMWPIL